MSMDILQEKIRKTKNPTMLELCIKPSDLPPFLMEEEGNAAAAYGRFSRELLDGLKGLVPAVRVSFASFALLGPKGMEQLEFVLKYAREQGFYVLLEAPEMLSFHSADMTADAICGEGSPYVCDSLLIGGYPGSDVIKPFLSYVKKGSKDLFVVARTSNKSAPELQDLLSGSRLVHVVATDHINRYGTDTAGKHGYTRVGALAAASTPESLKNLRSRYPKLFLLVDGADYPNANAKNCSYAFDKYGYGAIANVNISVTRAWHLAEGDSHEFVKFAVSAAERMKRNLNRYVNIL